MNERPSSRHILEFNRQLHQLSLTGRHPHSTEPRSSTPCTAFRVWYQQSMGLGDSSKPAADAQAAAAFGQGLWQIPGEQSNFAISIDTRDVETYIPPTRSSPFLGQQDKGKQGAAAALKAARASAYASDSGYAPSSASHHKRRLSDSEPVVYTHGQGHGGSPYDAGMRFVRFAGMTPHKRRSSTAAFMDYIKRHLPEDARPHRTPLTLTVKRGFLMFCVSHALGIPPDVRVLEMKQLLIGSCGPPCTCLRLCSRRRTWQWPSFPSRLSLDPPPVILRPYSSTAVQDTMATLEYFKGVPICAIPT